MRVLSILTWIPLLLASIGCSHRPTNGTPVNIETPDGTVTAHKTTVEPVPQQISVVRGEDLQRLQSLAQLGPDFVAAYLPGITNPDLKDYDRAFRAWQISDSPGHTSAQVTEILGGYLGNKCVNELELEWVTVTDEFGTEYGVRSKTVEVMAFPFSTVRKRIERNEFDFLYGVYHTIKHTIETGDYETRTPADG